MSKPRRSFVRYAFATFALTFLAVIAALAAGVSPARAASLVHRPDAQVLAFMAPLTLLFLAILFEVARVVIRGALPAQAPVRRPPRRPWTSERGEG